MPLAPHHVPVLHRCRDLGAQFASSAGTGEVGATEASFADQVDLPTAVVYTGNVTPYERFDVLVMRASSFAKLPPDEGDLMMSLAWRTLEHSLTTAESDSAAAQVYCKRGGAVVLAPASTPSAFELAAQPVIERLERDPVTGPALAGIRSVVASVPAEPLQHGCVPAAPAAPAAVPTPP